MMNTASLATQKDQLKFEKLNQFLFSALMKSCAGGTAASKIRKFIEQQDGQAAWNTLKDYYENEGNQEEYISDLTTQLANLHLEYNSHGGIDKYISDFENIVVKLEEAGEDLGDAFLKTTFIKGIHDKDYMHIKSMCHHEHAKTCSATIQTI